MVYCPLQTIAASGQCNILGQLLEAMGFSWDCPEFMITFNILKRNMTEHCDGTSFINLLFKDNFVLTVNLLLLLADLAPEEKRTDQSWIPPCNEILKLNSYYITRVGVSTMDLPSLACLCYEKLGRFKECEELAEEALGCVTKVVPRVTLLFVKGRCNARFGDDLGASRTAFRDGTELARRHKLELLVKMGEKMEKKWLREAEDGSERGGKLW